MATEKKNGYEGIYLWVVEKLAGFDLTGNAPHLGLKANDDGSVQVNFLNREYQVNSDGAKPLDGRPVGITHLSVVAHYAMSSGRGEPSLEFVSLDKKSGTVSGSQGSFQRESVSNPLVRKFGADQPALEAAVARIGGRPEGRSESGGWSWLFFPFPKMPLKLIYHEADEEFEAEFRLLYDNRCTDFMEFEAVAFVGGILVDELLSMKTTY